MASSAELKALIVLAGKIDPSLQKALLAAQGQTQKTSSTMKTLASSTNKFVGKMVKSAAVIGAAAGAGLLVVAKEGIELASDIEEVQNVVDVAFGESAEKINSWAQTALNSFGMSELQAKKFTGTLGAMLKSSGITGESLVTMSQNLSGLAGDFASFYNLDPEEAFNKIRAGISGETEPLKQIGINMSIANLEAFALSKGIKTAYKNMDQASQTALRFAYLMEVSKDAQGDFTRTQESFANQTRLLKTNLQELAAKVMSSMLPTLAKLAQKANEVISSISSDPAKLQAIQNTIMGIADKIGDVISFAGEAYNFIRDNWSVIEPMIFGIVSAIGAWILITNGLAAYKIVMDAIRLATGKATAAQVGFNAQVLANPLTWKILAISAAIGLLVAGIYYLWKNWDKVSAYMVGLWQNNLLPFFQSVGEFFSGIWTGITSGIKSAFIKSINWVIDKFNWLIEKANVIPGVNIPLIPTLPSGGGLEKFGNGGFANKPSIFGEAGLEAAIPIKYKNPRSISLLNQTARAIGADTRSGARPNLTLNFNFNGPVSNKEDVVKGVDMAKDIIYNIIDEYFEGKEAVSLGQIL